MTWQPLISGTQIGLFALVLLVLVGVGWWRSPVRPRLQRVLRLLRRAWLSVLLVVCLAGPSIPGEVEETFSNVEIYLVVDRTGSMVAEDYQEDSPRLEGVKADLEALLDATAGSRYAVITWDSSARLELPVTTDSSAVASFVDVLHQEITEFSTGSSMNRPLAILQQQLEAAAESRPQNLRYVLVFTDGEATDSADTEVSAEWATIGSLIDGGAVFGYGTEAGGQMLSYTRSLGQTGEYIKDSTVAGEPNATSSIDQESLQQMADYLGVSLYVNADAQTATEVGEGIMVDAEQVPEERSQIQTSRYLIWPFAAVAALLAIWEAVDYGQRLAELRRSRVI